MFSMYILSKSYEYFIFFMLWIMVTYFFRVNIKVVIHFSLGESAAGGVCLI